MNRRVEGVGDLGNITAKTKTRQFRFKFDEGREHSRLEEGSNVRIYSKGESVVTLIRRGIGRGGRSKEGEPHRLSLDCRTSKTRGGQFETRSGGRKKDGLTSVTILRIVDESNSVSEFRDVGELVSADLD